MKGLLRNNFIGVCANARIFSVFMFLFTVFVIAVVSQSAQISYAMIGMTGFSYNALAVVKNEYVSKWGKYKLTLPVKRADIVKSLFLNYLIWLLIGTLFVGTGISLSWFIHGCAFDQPVDILSMFALGISMSLFMGAVFFPLFFSGGEERSEVFLVISVLCALGMALGLVSVLNELLEPGLTAILSGAAALTGCSLLLFLVSYPLTVGIFRRKEY